MGLGGNELPAGDGDMNLEGVGLLPETDSELLRFVMTARLSFAWNRTWSPLNWPTTPSQ